MKLLEFKDKLQKGCNLGGEVVYIKEENLLYGIKSIYINNEDSSITILKSKEESIKTKDFIKILNEIPQEENISINIGQQEYVRSEIKKIKNIEFAQYNSIKMIFINV